MPQINFIYCLNDNISYNSLILSFISIIHYLILIERTLIRFNNYKSYEKEALDACSNEFNINIGIVQARG